MRESGLTDMESRKSFISCKNSRFRIYNVSFPHRVIEIIVNFNLCHMNFLKETDYQTIWQGQGLFSVPGKTKAAVNYLVTQHSYYVSFMIAAREET